MLLGHSSIKVTEKHYKPWVKTLQDKLETEAMKGWPSQPRGRKAGAAVRGRSLRATKHETRNASRDGQAVS
jgi:hypothetical protein